MDIMNEEQVIDILRKKFEKDREQNLRESRKYLEARDQMLSYIDKLEKNSPDLETLMTSGGIKYLIIDHGEGKTPRRGQKVIFDYISLLEKDKKEIDNSFNREQSAELIAGARQEIIGLDEAIFVMNKAMTAIFFIPSEKAYGKSGKAGIVPPDSDIIYFIRVKEIN
jgi:peptidylprolyl isomerase